MEIDNSAKATFQACPRRYYWRHVRELVPREVKNMGAPFGASIHEALSKLHKSSKLMENLEEAIGVFRSSYEKVYNGEDPERTPATGEMVIREYARRYNGDYIEPLVVEIGCSRLIDRNLVYSGRIDLIGMVGGEVAVVDHKTSSRPLSGYVVDRPNDQFAGYVFLARDAYPSVSTVIVNIIGTYVKKRLKDEQEERVTLMRTAVKVVEEDIEEFIRVTREVVERIERCMERGWWPKYTSACPQFGGCEYLRLCRSYSREEEEEAARVAYRREEWKPW